MTRGPRLARDRDGETRVHAALREAAWPEWAALPLVYAGGGFTALLNREHCGGHPTDPLRWHLSLSGPGRVPSWEELVDVAHQLRPGVPFVVGVPPRNLWLNLHPHVLHLWETADEALLTEWRANARAGDRPT